MHKPFFIIVLFSCIFSCKAQIEIKESETQLKETYTRLRVKKGWGFVNQKGDTIIPFGKYKFLNPIDEEDMILAHGKGKSGYINIKGDTIVPFIYEDLSVFSEGLAPAKKNGKYGFVDRKGTVVIPFLYENESHFRKCKLARVKRNGAYGFINQKGVAVLPLKYENVNCNNVDSMVSAKQNGKWAFFSCGGEQLTDFEFDKIKESRYNYRNGTYFENGLCLVEKNGRYAYLNKKLEVIVPFGTYDVCKPFRNFLSIVAKRGKFGIIDNLGNVILPLQYDLIEYPKEYSSESELFAVTKGKNIQFLDKNAKPITDFTIKSYEWDSYKNNEEKYNRYFVLTNTSGKMGTLSKNGTAEIPFIYETIEPFDGNPVTSATKGGKVGLIDTKGNTILPFKYDEIATGRFFDHYIVRIADMCSIVDKKGNPLFTTSYESITPVFYDRNNKFIVQKNGLRGIVDLNEKVIIPIQYDEISNWVEYGPDEHFVTKNNKKGLISREGKIVIPAAYDEIRVDNSKLIRVKNNGLYGTIDWNNTIVHPIKYQQILWKWPYLTRKPLNIIYLQKDGRYFSTDIKGKILEKSVSKKRIDEMFN